MYIVFYNNYNNFVQSPNDESGNECKGCTHKILVVRKLYHFGAKTQFWCDFFVLNGAIFVFCLHD